MIVLEARDITKQYGGTTALRTANFQVHSHAVNVLIGENGAGKSTLMKILAGVERPSAGQVILDGDPVAFASAKDAAARGIGIVYQELNLCPNLTVVDNIFLARNVLGRAGVVNAKAERQRAVSLLRRLDRDIDPDNKVSDLAVGEQQIVEIAKALAGDARILILDEPTSALSAAEVEVLFDVIAELKRDGVAIIYISHRLEELVRIGDFITVMRDGQVVATAPGSDVTIPWIVERMLDGGGRFERGVRQTGGGPIVVEVEGLCVERPSGTLAVSDISCAFRGGEITAIYGLLGSGRTEFLEAICGARRVRNGAIRLCGEPIDGLSIAQRVKRGLILVPEDRQRDALFNNLNVGGNISLSNLMRFTSFGLLSRTHEDRAIREMMEQLGVKAPSPATKVTALSGGNQQKVVIGRCLMPGPRALLLDEPSRGVDVGARAEVFDAMRKLAHEGLAVVFATSDMQEAKLVADRILVIAGGALTADMDAQSANDDDLVRASNSVLAATSRISKKGQDR